jgi:hypothetical protein
MCRVNLLLKKGVFQLIGSLETGHFSRLLSTGIKVIIALTSRLPRTLILLREVF